MRSNFVLLSCLLVGFYLFLAEYGFSQSSKDTPKSGKDSSQPYVKGITPGRAKSLVGVALGLISLVIGWRAKARSTAGKGNRGRNGAIIGISLGIIAIVLSIIHLYTSASSAFGSGGGKAGALVAVALSLIGISLSAFVLRRHKA